MSKPGTIAEAREAVQELVALQSNLAADLAAVKAQRAPAEKRLATNKLRRSKRPVVVLAANEHHRLSMAELRGGFGYIPKDTKPKGVPELVAKGEVKISLGSGYGFGASYTARGLSQRTMTPRPDDIKAWDRAIAARHRAEKKLDEARAHEKAMAAATFAGGTKVGFDELVADISADGILQLAVAALPDPYRIERELDRLVDGQYGRLTIAKAHLAHLVKKEDGRGCSTCEVRVIDEAKRAERRTRIEALPRRKATCPDHGKRLGYVERVREWEGNQQIAKPVWWCPVDFVRYADGKQLAADQAAAAKAEAKAARHQPRLVWWICPNPDCSDDEQESEPEAGQVVCDFCEVGWDIDRIKVTPVRPAKAA